MKEIVLVGESVRYAGRDMVLVKRGSRLQPFYRSTGRNSNKPGVWLPFDGTKDIPGIKGWIDKRRYIPYRGLNPDYNHPLFRYGTKNLKAISIRLGEIDIPPAAREVSAEEVNQWIARERYHHSRNGAGDG